jgi:RNA polymerase sigma-70 factor (ECF subfamily)
MTDPAIAREDDLGLQLLVLRCQAGDERAFAQLLDDFGPRTLRYLRGLLGDDAEDVHQEVWLAVYRSIATLARPQAFRTWLFSTTRRRAIDQLRRQRREQTLLADSQDDAGEIHDAPGDAAPMLDAGGIEQVLATLPATQREVLLLRYRDGMSYSEIAVIIGRPVGTVRTRIHHGKRKLRELLERGDI